MKVRFGPALNRSGGDGHDLSATHQIVFSVSLPTGQVSTLVSANALTVMTVFALDPTIESAGVTIETLQPGEQGLLPGTDTGTS